MPEGDELRRTALRLDRALAGAILTRAELRWPNASADLTSRTVLGTQAIGKHLLTRFDDGRTLHTHLRMDGRWQVSPAANIARVDADPDVRAILGTEERVAVGLRLGMLDVVRTKDEHLLVGYLGPDVLADDFPTSGLPAVLAAFTTDPRPVAEVLLDQQVQAGIGTIWLAESLFARRIWPWTPAEQVTDPASLLMTARTLMQRSVATPRGIEIRVHGRIGRPCPRCGTPIACGTARQPPTERPVFWCRRCQRHQRADALS